MAGSHGRNPSQLGRSAVVTGATGGLGYETALALAKAGAEVVLTGRDDRKGQAAIEKIGREAPAPGKPAARSCQPRLDRRFRERMQSRPSLDMLINNAGVMALPRRQTTADGFEMQFGTNYLGHFALTARLLPLLRKASRAAGRQRQQPGAPDRFIDFNDLQGQRVYSPWKAYGQSKLAMLMFALELQRRSDAAGLEFAEQCGASGICPHRPVRERPRRPGLACERLRSTVSCQSAADGARPILFAATSPNARPGAYYGPGGLGELRGAPAQALIMPQARDAAAAARLWDVSEKLTGTSFG